MYRVIRNYYPGGREKVKSSEKYFDKWTKAVIYARKTANAKLTASVQVFGLDGKEMYTIVSEKLFERVCK